MNSENLKKLFDLIEKENNSIEIYQNIIKSLNYDRILIYYDFENENNSQELNLEELLINPPHF